MPDESHGQLGEVLKLLRVCNGFSIKVLSEKIGLSAAYITELEKGKKTNPSDEVLQKYCDCLNVGQATIKFFTYDFGKHNYSYKKKLLHMLQKIAE